VLLLEDEMFPVALGELEDDAKPKEEAREDRDIAFE
jgi:hypothetical protein